MIQYMYENPIALIGEIINQFPLWLLIIIFLPLPLFFILSMMNTENDDYRPNLHDFHVESVKHEHVLSEKYYVKCEYCSSKDMVFNNDNPIKNCIHCTAPINYNNPETIIRETVKFEEKL